MDTCSQETAHATSASGTTASQLRPTSDYRHEHLPISLGVITFPRTDLASSPTASPTRSPRNHSHEPLPVSSGVISPSRTGLASATTASQFRSMVTYTANHETFKTTYLQTVLPHAHFTIKSNLFPSTGNVAT